MRKRMKRNIIIFLYVFHLIRFKLIKLKFKFYQHLFQVQAKIRNANSVEKISSLQKSLALAHLDSADPYLNSNELYNLWQKTKQAALNQVSSCSP